VANESAGTVARIDPRRNGVVQTINVGNGPSAVAAGASGIWVANSLDGTVTRINPGTNTVANTIPIRPGTDSVAVNGSDVWVTNDLTGILTRIDPEKNAVTNTTKVGNAPPGSRLQTRACSSPSVRAAGATAAAPSASSQLSLWRA
jgi:DNA-binding beta-propeller fold protein YncE